MKGTVRAVIVAAVLALVAAIWGAIARPPLGQLVHDFRWWILTVIVAAAVLLLGKLLISILLQPSLSATWQAHVNTEAIAIRHQLSSLSVPTMEPEHTRVTSIRRAVEEHVQAACKAASSPDTSPAKSSIADQLRDSWTGAKVEAAYINLHAAETALAQLLPSDEIEARIPEALARLQTMDVTDPRRRAAERQLGPNGTLWPSRRIAFQNAVRIGFELTDRQHARVRSFRNVVLTASLGLTVLVVMLCLASAHAPDAFPLCFGPAPTSAPVQGPPGVACPSEESPPTPGTHPRRLPAAGDVTMVALLGMTGGGLSAAVALRKLQGSSIPYSIPVALSLLKLPAGALSAIIGLLLVRGEFIPGLSQLDNQPQILAYAFIFGIAQQVVTRLIDRQAQDIITKVPSKEPIRDKPEPWPDGG